MPFGAPIVAMSLLDADAGDDRPAELQQILTDRLEQFRFVDRADRMDILEVRLRNDDYQLYDVPFFVAGQKFEVTWGWPGNMSPPRRMVVKRLKDEKGSVTVRAHCTLSLLNQRQRARFMQGVTDSEFVRAVAEEYGYTGALAIVETTTLRHDLTQPRWWTDAQYLHRLAKRNGFQFFIDADGLHWHSRPTDRAPLRQFVYRVDAGRGAILAPPEFEVNMARAITRVRVVSIDPVRKMLVEQTAGIDDEGHVALSREDDLFDPDDPDVGRRGARVGGEEVISAGLMSAEEALARATARYRETAAGRYRCTLQIVGDPRLGAKCLVGLWGDLPATMAGLYYVRQAVTEIAAGKFTQELHLRKDSRAESPAARKRRPRTRVNPQAEVEMDFTGFEEAPDEAMQIMLTGVVDASGATVPAYIWTADGGRTGQTSLLTDEQFEALTPAQQTAWQHGPVALPDQ